MYTRSLQAALICAACFSSVYGQSAQLLMQGRFAGDVNEQTGFGSLPLLFSWPASSISTSFVSTSVNVTITAVPANLIISSYNRFAIYVDGQQVAIESTDPNNTVISWSAAGLSSGEHNLTITKMSEATYGEASLDAINLGTGGKFMTPELPAAVQTGRRIMFIGDSFTVGYGNTGGTTHCNATACNPVSGSCLPELDSEDARLSWGPLTAANFTADYQMIAWSGAGLATYSVPDEVVAEDPEVPLWLAELEVPMDITLFDRQVAADNSSMVSNFSSWVPQVVILASGANDFHTPPAPLDDWRAAIIEFIMHINEEFDTPEIIIQVYPVEAQVGIILLTIEETAQYIQYMSDLFTAVQQEGLTNVHFLQINAVDMPLDGWCQEHPSAAAHQVIAAQLSSFIEGVIPEWSTMTYPLSANV